MRVSHFVRLAAGMIILTGVALSGQTHAQTIAAAVADGSLGVSFSSLPSGWFFAAPGVYTPGTIGLVTLRSNREYDVRLSVQPLGTGDTHDEIAADQTAADKVVKASNSSTPITRTPVTLAGAHGVMLEGIPGPSNVQIIVAHAGALYDVVTFDSNSIQPDQAQALASMHFNPRIGAFPSSNPPAPRGPSQTRHIPPLRHPMGSSAGPSLEQTALGTPAVLPVLSTAPARTCTRLGCRIRRSMPTASPLMGRLNRRHRYTRSASTTLSTTRSTQARL